MNTCQRTRRQVAEPRWRAQSQLTQGQLQASTRQWLLDDSSLSQRLATTGAFSVERRYQSWQRPFASERKLLGLPDRELTLVREVVLRVNGKAVVFARSVFPLRCLKGKLGHLSRLKNRSLGSVLFSQPGMQRTPFELALISGRHSWLPLDLQQQQTAFCRRSRFHVGGCALIVSEVFLEAFKPWRPALRITRSLRSTVNTGIVRPTQ